MIRAIRSDDFDELKRIHEKFYKDEFDFPNFLDNYLCVFVVLNSCDEIISAVGLKKIIECVVLTDKDKPMRELVTAMNQGLEAALNISNLSGFPQIHAFVQEKSWASHLAKEGFTQCKGEVLFRSTKD